MKIYYRQSFKERGHFSNNWTFNPVNELGFGAEALRIVQGGSTVEIPYKQLNARIIERYIHKSYGAGIGGKMKQTLISLERKKEKYTFDLSIQFPDFRSNREILALIKERINYTVSKESRKQFKRKENIQLTTAVTLALIVIVFSIVSKCSI